MTTVHRDSYNVVLVGAFLIPGGTKPRRVNYEALAAAYGGQSATGLLKIAEVWCRRASRTARIVWPSRDILRSNYFRAIARYSDMSTSNDYLVLTLIHSFYVVIYTVTH